MTENSEGIAVVNFLINYGTYIFIQFTEVSNFAERFYPWMSMLMLIYKMFLEVRHLIVFFMIKPYLTSLCVLKLFVYLIHEMWCPRILLKPLFTFKT